MACNLYLNRIDRNEFSSTLVRSHHGVSSLLPVIHLHLVDNNIGWVARPKHDDSEGGFKRRGRFKKASNMNYGLSVSLRMEGWIKKLEDQKAQDASSHNSHDEEEEDIEEKALRLALEEIYEENGKRWQPWARNAKSIRMGEIILIVDSDTIVPEVRSFCIMLNLFGRRLPKYFSPSSGLLPRLVHTLVSVTIV